MEGHNKKLLKRLYIMQTTTVACLSDNADDYMYIYRNARTVMSHTISLIHHNLRPACSSDFLGCPIYPKLAYA